MPIMRCSEGSRVTSLSPNRIGPPLGSSSPATQRSVVVLPHPDGPSRETNSPSATSRSTPCTAVTPPNTLLSPSILSRDNRRLSSRHAVPPLDHGSPLPIGLQPVERHDVVQILGREGDFLGDVGRDLDVAVHRDRVELPRELELDVLGEHVIEERVGSFLVRAVLQ